jgi:hypothetical protein
MFDDLPQVGYLPPTRAPRCKREYKKLADAFHKEISPHIDRDMAKRVLQTNWLPGPVLRREPRKYCGRKAAMTGFLLSSE